MESEQAKLFVGGISRDTDEETLKEHFSKYGLVSGSAVAKDRITKSPRCFGFIWFSDSSSADKALHDTHFIQGRKVEVKKAIPRSEQHHNQQQQPRKQQNSETVKNNSNGNINSQFRTKKIFVGGLSPSLTEEEFKDYFERFGRTTDVVVMHDSVTNRPRGFGFVTFESEESVENAMQNSFHELKSRTVEVKRAVPKEEMNLSNTNHNARFGVGRGSPHDSHQHCEHPPKSPGYGMFSGYAPLTGCSSVGGFLYGTGPYGCGFPIMVSGRMGYGVSSLTLGSSWYTPMVPGVVYPAYVNGGYGLMGRVADGNNAIQGPAVNRKLNRILEGDENLPVNASSPQLDGIKLDVDSLGLNKSSGDASSEQDQRGLAGKL